MYTRALALILPLVVVASACSQSSGSSSSGDAGCVAYNPGNIDLTKPTVSFKTDVMNGVFAKSCSLSSSCHGSPSGSQGGLFLGDPKQQGADASKVRAAIVGVMSQELTSMPFVTAGDPTKSFIMRKMDGDQCTLDAQCVGGTCQSSMPQGSDLLPAAQYRDVVRRWIAQGAQDN